MPFVGVNINKERIDITKIENPKTNIIKGTVFCPACNASLIIKDGAIKRSHFAHKTEDISCPYSIYERGESDQHRTAKMWLAENAGTILPDYCSATSHMEYYLPSSGNRKNRIADILFEFKAGWRTAHEIQLSPQDVTVLNERTDDYASMGIDVIWWFGGKALEQKHNEIWSIERYGGQFRIYFEKEKSVFAVGGNQYSRY
jgi:competence CoiA-like predicted nuclease